MSVADRLDDMADYIEQHGWVQGRMRETDGRVCLLGAARMTCEVDEWADINKVLVSHLDWSPGVVVAQWNDQPSRTEQEVLDTLRFAAKQERTKL